VFVLLAMQWPVMISRFSPAHLYVRKYYHDHDEDTANWFTTNKCGIIRGSTSSFGKRRMDGRMDLLLLIHLKVSFLWGGCTVLYLRWQALVPQQVKLFKAGHK